MRTHTLKVKKVAGETSKLVPNSKAVVSHLRDLENVSRFLKFQLREMGYVEFETIPRETRGRPAYNWKLTPKANGLLAIAKNWGKKENFVKIESEAEAEVSEAEAEANENYAIACEECQAEAEQLEYA